MAALAARVKPTSFGRWHRTPLTWCAPSSFPRRWRWRWPPCRSQQSALLSGSDSSRTSLSSTRLRHARVLAILVGVENLHVSGHDSLANCRPFLAMPHVELHARFTSWVDDSSDIATDVVYGHACRTCRASSSLLDSSGRGRCAHQRDGAQRSTGSTGRAVRCFLRTGHLAGSPQKCFVAA